MKRRTYVILLVFVPIIALVVFLGPQRKDIVTYSQKDPMNSPRDFSDYDDRSRRLSQFDAGLDAILQESLGRDWLMAKPEDEDRLLTQRQRDWRELRYFYDASIVNSGDLFSYLWIVYDRLELFKEIEAVKTLAAAEELRPLHDVYSQLQTEYEKSAYWSETRERREPIEQKAEGVSEFADLLIRYAERYPTDFPEVEPQDPFDRVSELIESLRRDANENGLDTEGLDTATRLFKALESSSSGAED